MVGCWTGRLIGLAARGLDGVDWGWIDGWLDGRVDGLLGG